MRERELHVIKFNKKCVRELLRRRQIKQIKIKLENNF